MLNKSLTVSQRNKVCLEEEMKNLKLLSDAAILRSQEMQVSKQHEVSLQARCYDLQKEALGKESSFSMLATSRNMEMATFSPKIGTVLCLLSCHANMPTSNCVFAPSLQLSLAILPFEESGLRGSVSSTMQEFSSTKWNFLCCFNIPRGYWLRMQKEHGAYVVV